MSVQIYNNNMELKAIGKDKNLGRYSHPKFCITLKLTPKSRITLIKFLYKFLINEKLSGFCHIRYFIYLSAAIKDK